MKLFLALSFFAITGTACVTPTLEERATPKIYLAGDSTMASGGGGSGTNGWGEWLHYSLNLTVIDSAVAGRSARSYTVEGRFIKIAAALNPGDFVLVEFGHNDGGSPIPTDNNRSDCPGSGSQTCTTTAGVVVQTFPTYMINAAKLMLAKGAKVIISSQTPNNPWGSGKFSYAPNRFVTYASEVVQALENPNVVFVDHGLYVANEYKSLGRSTVEPFFPNDHTHTSPAGATVVEKAFMKGLMCGGSALGAYSKNCTGSIEGDCV